MNNVSILCEAYAPLSVMFVSVFSFCLFLRFKFVSVLLIVEHEVGPWGRGRRYFFSFRYFDMQGFRYFDFTF